MICASFSSFFWLIVAAWILFISQLHYCCTPFGREERQAQDYFTLADNAENRYIILKTAQITVFV
jgi:hypothetical protein